MIIINKENESKYILSWEEVSNKLEENSHLEADIKELLLLHKNFNKNKLIFNKEVVACLDLEDLSFKILTLDKGEKIKDIGILEVGREPVVNFFNKEKAILEAVKNEYQNTYRERYRLIDINPEKYGRSKSSADIISKIHIKLSYQGYYVFLYNSLDDNSLRKTLNDVYYNYNELFIDMKSPDELYQKYEKIYNENPRQFLLNSIKDQDIKLNIQEKIDVTYKSFSMDLLKVVQENSQIIADVILDRFNEEEEPFYYVKCNLSDLYYEVDIMDQDKDDYSFDVKISIQSLYTQGEYLMEKLAKRYELYDKEINEYDGYEAFYQSVFKEDWQEYFNRDTDIVKGRIINAISKTIINKTEEYIELTQKILIEKTNKRPKLTEFDKTLREAGIER